jgi:hypothetical protein
MNDLRLKQFAILLGMAKAVISFILITKYSQNKNAMLLDRS